MKRRRRLAASLLACVLCPPATEAFGTPTLPDFASYASREEAAVVSISTVTPPRRRAVDDEVPPSDGDDLPSSPSPIGDSVVRHAVRGLASGFIISADGHILTSAHVVSGVGDMTVRLADGREFVGRVVGVDELSDVAVVRIDAQRLAVAPVGDPAKVAVGDWVSAIGAPFGLETSVTAGIVSAKRLLPGSGGILFLQTDVAVNPGSWALRCLGDRILSVNGTVVHRIADYEAALARLPANDYVALLVLRDGGVQFFALGASARER